MIPEEERLNRIGMLYKKEGYLEHNWLKIIRPKMELVDSLAFLSFGLEFFTERRNLFTSGRLS